MSLPVGSQSGRGWTGEATNQAREKSALSFVALFYDDDDDASRVLCKKPTGGRLRESYSLYSLYDLQLRLATLSSRHVLPRTVST